jgi:hypothetical protein
MPDEPIQQPEPFEASSLDKALAELNKPEPTPEAAPAEPAAAPAADKTAPGTEPSKPAESKPTEPAKPADGKSADVAGPFKVGEEAKFKISDVAVKTREEIDKLPYANDATFKAIMGEFEQLAQFRTGIGQALNEVESVGGYKIGDADTMKAVVADAYNLYDVINLKASPTDLLELAAKNYGEENINQVVAQILQYAEEKKITKEMYSDLSKPENKKIFDLAKESRERKAREATETTAKQRQAEEKQKETDFASLEKHVGNWAKENKIADEDIIDYLTFAVAQIGGNQKELEAIRAGKFGEVERILTEYNNRMVERQARWEKALTSRKTDREKKLGNAPPAAGAGTPPAEPKPKKVDINNDDERMDAVRAALRG